MDDHQESKNSVNLDPIKKSLSSSLNNLVISLCFKIDFKTIFIPEFYCSNWLEIYLIDYRGCNPIYNTYAKDNFMMKSKTVIHNICIGLNIITIIFIRIELAPPLSIYDSPSIVDGLILW